MNHSSRGTRLLENIAMLLLLSMRGLLLWVLIPFAFLAGSSCTAGSTARR